jgi:hypothetical protein
MCGAGWSSEAGAGSDEDLKTALNPIQDKGGVRYGKQPRAEGV